MANKYREEITRQTRQAHKAFRSRKKGHRTAQILHSAGNLKRRHNMKLTKPIRRDVRHQIESGKAVLLRKQSCAVQEYEVQINDKPVRVVYNVRRKNLVTVLPGEGE